MAAQHHFISQFHLKQFTDPDSLALKDPWLWQGFIPDGPIKRRAPKNVATVNLMFDGPGGLADRDSTLESFLSNEVEGPAAQAMREVCRRPSGTGGDLAPELMRYLSWAAARSLPMQTLANSWGEMNFSRRDDVVEPPPDGLLRTRESGRDVQMLHPQMGRRVFSANADMAKAAADGWYPDMSERTNFLEGVHIQAYYFQTRFFPRFNWWFTLHAPEGDYFVIADRAVGWAADGYVDAPPSCLRDPLAYVIAPISRTLVLVGKHTMQGWQVTPGHINAVIACWAHEWIAGPTEATVESALAARRLAM